MADGSRLVLITAPLPEQALDRLNGISSDLRVEQRLMHPPGDAAAEAIPAPLWAEVEVLCTQSTLPAPEQAPNLRWVQLHSAGINQVVNKPLYQTDVAFTTASGVHAVPIAEYVLAMMLAWFHRLPLLLEWQQRAKWPPDDQRFTLFTAEELAGKTIGIAGYGSIGREVARLAVAHGMRVLATQRGEDHRDRGFVFPGVGDPQGVLPERYFPPERLHDLLRESDVVVIALPLTPATRGLFDRAAFQAMKPAGFLVNIARGDICDEDALVRALQAGQIAGAALDVTHREPLPPDSPLWRLSNVILSPHISGSTPRYDERVAQIFEANLRRYLAGEPLYNLVDKGQGY
jgi:phosphoglycerate dehydrogenase-like enzyme